MVYHQYTKAPLGKGTVLEVPAVHFNMPLDNYARVKMDAIPRKPGFVSQMGREIPGKAAVPVHEVMVSLNCLKRLVPKAPSDG